MSRREVRALQSGPLPESELRAGKKRKSVSSNMSGSKSEQAVETLRAEEDHLRAQLENKDEELSELRSSLRVYRVSLPRPRGWRTKSFRRLKDS